MWARKLALTGHYSSATSGLEKLICGCAITYKAVGTRKKLFLASMPKVFQKCETIWGCDNVKVQQNFEKLSRFSALFNAEILNSILNANLEKIPPKKSEY